MRIGTSTPPPAVLPPLTVEEENLWVEVKFSVSRLCDAGTEFCVGMCVYVSVLSLYVCACVYNS